MGERAETKIVTKVHTNDVTDAHTNDVTTIQDVTTPSSNPTTVAQSENTTTNSSIKRNSYVYTNITATISVKNLCMDKPDIVGYVLTRAGDFKRRDVIRRTYGRIKEYNDTHVTLLFVLGTTDTKEMQQGIQEEADKYNDVIQMNVSDAYRLLAPRNLNAMKWIVDHCAHAQMFFKVDDDVFVNMYRLVEFYPRWIELKDSEDQFYCKTHEYVQPERTRTKWRVTMEEYSGHLYPTYCHGSAEIFSRGVVQRIYDVTNSTDFFWIDDVFVTGILRQKAKVGITHFYPNFGRASLMWHIPDSFSQIKQEIFGVFFDISVQRQEQFYPVLSDIVDGP